MPIEDRRLAHVALLASAVCDLGDRCTEPLILCGLELSAIEPRTVGVVRPQVREAQVTIDDGEEESR